MKAINKEYKEIGKGSFSSVYRKGNSDKVLIVSRDNVKECMALGWFPNSRLFPKIDKISVNNDGTRTYKMKYFEKITAPKQQLNKRSYTLYKALRDLFQQPYQSEVSRRMHWIDSFNTLPNSFKHQKNALIAVVNTLANYGTDICFEISPRNIAATKTGNLILLDCFWFESALYT